MVDVGGGAGATRVSRHRRLVAMAVFVASLFALLATSYSPVQSRLIATHHGSVHLTADAPRAIGRVSLDLSAQALPESEARRRVHGEVRFSPRGDSEDVALTVTAVGQDTLPTADFGTWTFPINHVCRVAEPCEVEFEVVLEWASPDGDVRAASFIAELEVVYEEVEHNPDGASASWTETSGLAVGPDGPFVSATTEPERITLDEDAFAASRQVEVAASEHARGGVTAVLVSTDASRAAPGRVLVTVEPDGAGLEAGGESEPIDLFADCPSNDRCERGLTVTFQLVGEPQDKPAIFEWQVEVRSTFPAAEAAPEGATLDVAIQNAVGVTRAAPRLGATIDGAVTLEGADDQASGRHATTLTLRIDVAAGGLRARGFAGMPATSLATLSLTSEHEGTAEIGVDAGDVGEDVGTVKIGPDRTGALLFNPLRSCPLERACSRWVTLRITPLRRNDPSMMEVSWTLDLAIAYPGLSEVPVGAKVDLTVDPRSQ